MNVIGGRMKVRVSVLLALMLAPGIAQAADWVYVTTSTNNADYYMDKGSVRKTSSGYPKKEITLAWFKVDYSRDTTVSRRESKILYHFDCLAQQMGIAHWVDYDPQGKVIDSTSSSYPTFRPAVPDTIGHSMLDQACFAS
ncbi:MAG: hypothetical protein IE934_12185 [Sphingopyxis sp.]|nr:hypothetical protein [Sphingopyxis sp.]